MNALLETVHGIHLLHPGWLWAWLPAMLIAAVLLRARRLHRLSSVPGTALAPHYRHPRAALLRGLRRGAAGRPGWRSLAGYGVVLLCLHLALAHPYRVGDALPAPPEYRDTVFLVDTSLTMILRDYAVGDTRIDRMSILKGVLTRFAERLQGNRIGLIVFSSRPYTLMPLTADRAVLQTMIARLEPAVLTGRTTDLGTALLYALRELHVPASAEAGHRPTLVLLSDVNRSPRDVDPRAVAAELAARGFRLHTIGIGAGAHEAREDTPAGLIYQPTNFRLLRSIAEQGGGRFYWADSVDSLEAAIEAIQAGERRAVETAPRHVTIPLYHWPLLAGLLWLMAVQLLAGVRRRA